MRFRDRVRSFMMGRYGNDRLNRFLCIASLVCLVISVILSFVGVGAGVNVLYFVGVLLLIYSYVRMLSRNIQKRYAENAAYCRLVNRITGFFRTKRVHFAQRGMYRYYKCPNCRQQLRVPHGKGKIEITCPKCHTSFIKKT